MILCRPTTTGLGEAQDLWCVGCHATTRHWLWTTNDVWYDPMFYWQCGDCARTRSTPRWTGGEPLLWKMAVEDVVARARAEIESEPKATVTP